MITFCLPGLHFRRTLFQSALSLSAFTLACFSPAAWSQTTTTTALTVTANGVPLTTIDTRTTVRLTATVMAGSAKVTTGQVNFCNADFAKSCQDFRLVGMAQLTSDGTAVVRFIPGPGVHHYKAVFLGTASDSSSSSSASTLAVQGGPAPHATKTSIVANGGAGSYTLTANVTGPASALPLVPGGTVFFQDRSQSGKVLGQAALPGGLPAVNYTGTSKEFSNQTSANSAHGLAVGDFNNDGKPDLVVCGDSYCPGIALGNGDGTFQSPEVKTPAAASSKALVADFNGDGNLDLAIAFSARATSSNQLYFGTGHGTFLAPIAIPLPPAQGTGGTIAAVADFNYDGIPDLVVNYQSSVGILLGNGNGTFHGGWNRSPNSSYSYFGAVTGDFDGDGLQDFAEIVDFESDRHVGTFYGTTDGGFTEVESGEVGYPYIEAADVNGDGRTDLLVTDDYSGEYADGYYPGFIVYYGRVDRKYKGRYSHGVDLNKTALNPFVQDFNGDGISDVAFGELQYDADLYPTQVVLLGNGDGSFTQATRVQSQTAAGLVGSAAFRAADFNGDGLPDLAAIGTQGDSGKPAYGALLTQAGQTASASIQPPTGDGPHAVVARYSGDENFVTSVSKPVELTTLSEGSPAVTLSSTFLEFGQVTTGQASSAQTVLLTNAGTGALTISSIGVVVADYYFDDPPFASSNNCPSSLAAGASCKIRVRFVPGGGAGNKSRFLKITDNAGNSPPVVTLTGTGVKP